MIRNKLVFLVRLISIIVGIASVKVSIDAIGQSNYGFWVSMLSVLSWVSFVDGGVGNALRNTISNKKTSHKQKKQEHNSAYFVVGSNSILVLAIIFFTLFIPSLFGDILPEKRNTIIVASAIVLLQLPMKLLYSVRAGYGNYNILVYITTLAQILNLLGIVGFMYFGFARLDTFAACSLLPGAFTLLVYNAFCIIGMDRRFFTDFQYVYRTNRASFKFLLLQLLGAVTLNGATFVVNSRVGSIEATSFFTYWKILFLPLSFYTIILGNEWNKFSSAIRQDENRFNLKDRIRINLKVLVVFSSSVLLLVLIVNKFLSLADFDIKLLPNKTIILIGIWALLSLSSGLLSTIQNSINDLWCQILTGSVMVVGLFILWAMHETLYLNQILWYLICALLLSQIIQIYYIQKSEKYFVH